MNTHTVEVKDYLEKKLVLKVNSIKPLGQGESNQNFIVVTDKGKKLVIREKRKDVPGENLLANEHHVLKFLEEEGIDFVPRSILFDSNKLIHVISYVPGKDASLCDLDGFLIEIFVKQLQKINNTNYKQFVNYCERSDYHFEKPRKPIEVFKKYTLNRFNYIKKHCPKKYYIDWIEPRLKENQKRAEKAPKGKARLLHGDLGKNIKIFNKSVWFIDWELARFQYDVALSGELSYILLRSDCSKSKMDDVIKLYSKCGNYQVDEIKEDVNEKMKVNALNSVIWAARRYSEMHKNGMDGLERYEDMAKQRIEKYTRLFEASSV